uniref:Uncharacterized protein n=1 Tax=Arundo donax TaxID=35708 RepID=A0A0A9DTP4_ARUDO
MIGQLLISSSNLQLCHFLSLFEELCYAYESICASHTTPLAPRCPRRNRPSHEEEWVEGTAYLIRANSHTLHSNSIQVRESASPSVVGF